jgi:hypothetical protein
MSAGEDGEIEQAIRLAMRELGKRGGRKTSLRKKLAVQQNVAKAREALRRKREAERPQRQEEGRR